MLKGFRFEFHLFGIGNFEHSPNVFQVIPAKSHANIALSFTPYPTAEVPKDMDCIGYMLGYMSLDNEKAVRQEGLVTRSQAYDTAQVRLDMTAHLKPAL